MGKEKRSENEIKAIINIKETFIERFKERKEALNYKDNQAIANAMLSKYKEKIDNSCNKKFINHINKWCSNSEDNLSLPDFTNLYILSEVLQCDSDYLMGKQDRPCKDIMTASVQTGLSYEALSNLHSHELLEYLLENSYNVLYEYFDTIWSAAQEDADYTFYKPTITATEYKPGGEGIYDKGIHEVSTLDEITPLELHRNLVKMERSVEEWGNYPQLLREAMKCRIAKLNQETQSIRKQKYQRYIGRNSDLGLYDE